MEIINLSEQQSILGQYLAEIRDKDYQKNRTLFRRNIQRIGEIMAFNISRLLTYAPIQVETPLGTATVEVPEDKIVIATVLRAGLPFHEGFLHVFDHAENGFVSAFRMYTNREHTEVGVHTEYMACPSLEGKTLIIVDPMLIKNGKPKQVHVACVIATPEGLEVLKQSLPPENTTVWAASVDPGMDEHKYIVPGFGDAGDLCYGEKI